MWNVLPQPLQVVIPARQHTDMIVQYGRWLTIDTHHCFMQGIGVGNADHRADAQIITAGQLHVHGEMRSHAEDLALNALDCRSPLRPGAYAPNGQDQAATPLQTRKGTRLTYSH